MISLHVTKSLESIAKFVNKNCCFWGQVAYFENTFRKDTLLCSENITLQIQQKV